MSKLTAIERAVQNIDEKIAALQLARQHLIEQAKPKTKVSRPRVVDKLVDREGKLA